MSHKINAGVANIATLLQLDFSVTELLPCKNVEADYSKAYYKFTGKADDFIILRVRNF